MQREVCRDPNRRPLNYAYWIPQAVRNRRKFPPPKRWRGARGPSNRPGGADFQKWLQPENHPEKRFIPLPPERLRNVGFTTA